MGCHDLSANGKSQSGAGTLGRVEGAKDTFAVFPLDSGTAIEITDLEIADGAVFLPIEGYNPYAKYCFVTTAYNEFGESDPSNEACNSSFQPTIQGDLNSDGAVDLQDAIVAIQIQSNMQAIFVQRDADVNGDGFIGAAEAIYLLQKVGEIR